MRSRAPSVTVYVLCHNYGRFLGEAISSVRSQVFPDWELLIVNDGSTDNTSEVLDEFRDDARIRVLENRQHQGLRASANRSIRESRGSFVLRLDADDLLHPYCLSTYWHEAMRDQDVNVLFSDYYYIDEAGDIVGIEASRRDDRAQTFPPHGSGSFVRRDTFDRIGLYDDSLDADIPGAAAHGQELWLKVLRAGLRARHIPLPLFLYRQHGPSVSSDAGALIRAQGKVKRRLAEGLARDERIVAIIPVRETQLSVPDTDSHGSSAQSLLEGAIRAAQQTQSISDVLVTTDSPEVVQVMRSLHARVPTFLRPTRLRQPTTSIREVLQDLAVRAGLSEDVILCLVGVHIPRRTQVHIQKALDNYLLYDVDSVVAVHEERSPTYQMGSEGLKPVNPSFQYGLRREREAVYIDSGAVRVFRVRNLREAHFLGRRIGHSLMPPEDAVKVTSTADVNMFDQPMPTPSPV
jgi:CMP-N-acetylneuraminic acid synthetase